jgi:hypothetical protein
LPNSAGAPLLDSPPEPEEPLRAPPALPNRAPKARNTEYVAISGCTPAIFELAADDADGDAREAADQRDEHRLGQELGEDVAAARADRLADADLAGPLGDADEHDVHHADPADEQRDRGDLAEQRGEHAARGAGRFQQRALVEDVEAGFFGVLDLVAFLDDLLDLSFGCVEADSEFACTVIESIVPTPVSDVCDGCDRRHHDVVLVAGSVAPLLGEDATTS